MDLPCPTIFLPGILGTELRDDYPLPAKTVYSMWTNVPLVDASGDFERIALHPDDLRYERIEPASVRADSILSMMYKEFVLELRHSLSKDPARPVPVYAFPYDWRHPLESTEDRLATFIDEVIARTQLMRHYAKDAAWKKHPAVNLVGHSMGGLVITGLLARKPEISQKVARVATIGTPYRGSIESVTKLCMGISALGSDSSSAREREAARMTPALYYLLPDYPKATSPSVDLFDQASWQSGIVMTLKRHLDEHSIRLGGKATDRDAAQLLARFLAAAAAHRKLTATSAVPGGLDEAEWLAIVGIGEKTRTQIHVREKAGERPQFDFVDAEKDGGDGTVPVAAAQPSFLAPANVVAVSSSDLSMGEIGDRLLKMGAGLHATLPSINLVQRLVVSLFQGTREGPPGGHPLPGIPRTRWKPPHSLEAKARTRRWETHDPSG